MEKEQIPALSGLTTQEAEERAAQGQINRADISTGKSVGEIIRSNTFTYFNLIFLILAVMLCLVGSYRNLTFLPVVIGNALIGIIQELRAKRVLDKMNLLNAPHAVVVRDGQERQIGSEELVKDDLIFLTEGDQICADAVVAEGSVQVNEALLTGEADEIEKKAGDELLSGSFVVSGQCYAKLEKVGNESYIQKLSAEAKATGGTEQSEMIRSINRIVKWMGILIIPVGAVIFWQSFYQNGETLQKSVVSMVAAVVGMIPEGLYLLTTAALALGSVRLAKKKVLLHDMKSIEALARVDVLCVDKTGTITEPAMKVVDIVPCSAQRAASDVSVASENVPDQQEAETGAAPAGAQMQAAPDQQEALKKLLTDYAIAVGDDNATMRALKEHLSIPEEDNRTRKWGRRKGGSKGNGGEDSQNSPSFVLPFSSSAKYSGVRFAKESYVLGAPEILLREDYGLIGTELSPFLKKGYRVLLLGRYAGDLSKEGLMEKVVPLGYVVLANPVRENAKETFSYFKEQGVAIKVISGDNAETVAEVAGQAGIENADRYIDARMLETDEQLEGAVKIYTVFGRVTPKQKQRLVNALQKAGHTVAMTGDGVNDILAMKDADCSVAMASGSEAAAQAAQVVLLDSDFAHMPNVVLEGRRVVNNIQRSASLFLVKNIFSLLLSVFSVAFGITYPLEPSQISLISSFTIGIPGFLLALEPNFKRIQGRFMKNVLLKAIPAGLTDVLAVGALVVCGEVFMLPKEDIATAATLLLAVVGFIILTRISRPFNAYKYATLAVCVLGLALCGIFLPELFSLNGMSQICILLLVVFSFAAESMFRYLTLAVEKLDSLRKRRKEHGA